MNIEQMAEQRKLTSCNALMDNNEFIKPQLCTADSFTMPINHDEMKCETNQIQRGKNFLRFGQSDLSHPKVLSDESSENHSMEEYSCKRKSPLSFSKGSLDEDKNISGNIILKHFDNKQSKIHEFVSLEESFIKSESSNNSMTSIDAGSIKTNYVMTKGENNLSEETIKYIGSESDNFRWREKIRATWNYDLLEILSEKVSRNRSFGRRDKEAHMKMMERRLIQPNYLNSKEDIQQRVLLSTRHKQNSWCVVNTKYFN